MNNNSVTLMLFQSCVTWDTNIGSTGSQCSSDYLLFYFTEGNRRNVFLNITQQPKVKLHLFIQSLLCVYMELQWWWW